MIVTIKSLKQLKRGDYFVNKYFYCYSYPLKEFFIRNGEVVILSSVHSKTQKKFWIFESNDNITKLLEKWRLQKK